MTSSSNPLDPYTAKAEDHKSLTPQQKIKEFHEIMKATKTAMLTTRAASGHLHSRAMNPAGPFEDSQLTLAFIANNVSHKFDEIEHDAHVNVSFCDHSSTNWASYSGIAKITQDKEVIKKHWSNSTSAYFGDLHDGVHKGDENDPRVSIIEVVPEEIRYWITHSSAAMGKATATGELSTITKEEIELTQGLNTV